MTEKQYIGDGVYVNFDGYQLELSTARDGGVDKIYLEPGICCLGTLTN